MPNQVGRLSEKIVSLLSLPIQPGEPILLGESNIQHMKSRHPTDYHKYGTLIPQILASPDYVGCNPTDHSIEYVKDFQINGEYVKVAVRLSGNHVLYARSLYVLNPNRVKNFIRKGTLKKI